MVAGTYPVTLTATNAGGTVTQAFTLTVNAAGTPLVPTFTSPAAVTRDAGAAFTFTVTTVGSPTTYTTNVTESGKLPGGVWLAQQRQRDRHAVRHADRGRRRRLPGHDHR